MEQNFVYHLTKLSQELGSGRYKPGSVRIFPVTKADGRKRIISALTLRDKLAQRAVLTVLNPIGENLFHQDSFGYRPGRSIDAVMARVNEHLRCGYLWLVDADIKSFFDEIPHAPLQKKLKKIVPDREVYNLLIKWLDIGAPRTGILARRRGIPQGGVLSPFFCNVYLTELDTYLTRNNLPFVRFADDFLVFTSSKQAAQEALKCVGIGLKKTLPAPEPGQDPGGQERTLGDVSGPNPEQTRKRKVLMTDPKLSLPLCQAAPLFEIEVAKFALPFLIQDGESLRGLERILRGRVGYLLKARFCPFVDFQDPARDCSRCERSEHCLYPLLFKPGDRSSHGRPGNLPPPFFLNLFSQDPANALDQCEGSLELTLFGPAILYFSPLLESVWHGLESLEETRSPDRPGIRSHNWQCLVPVPGQGAEFLEYPFAEPHYPGCSLEDWIRSDRFAFEPADRIQLDCITPLDIHTKKSAMDLSFQEIIKAVIRRMRDLPISRRARNG